MEGFLSGHPMILTDKEPRNQADMILKPVNPLQKYYFIILIGG